MIEIVVARYNENLSWMNLSPFNEFKYTIYNKGFNNNFEQKYINKVINLPNVGRCDHTYLYHIVENFDNLANITIFFPGSINAKHKIYNAIKIINEIKKYKKGIFLANNTPNIKNKFNNFTINTHRCNDPINLINNTDINTYPSNIRPYGNWFVHHFGNIIVNYSCWCSIFSLSKQDIIKNNKNKYIKILNELSKHSNPEVGHYVERSWVAIFHPLIYTKIIINDDLYISRNIIKNNTKLFNTNSENSKNINSKLFHTNLNSTNSRNIIVANSKIF